MTLDSISILDDRLGDAERRDEFGLTRSGHTLGDPNYVTGWFVAGWMPIPDAPAKIEE